MNSSLARLCLAASLAVLIVAPLRAQKSGSPPSGGSGSGNGPSTGSSPGTSGQPQFPSSTTNQVRTPIRVSGRILTETGQPPGEAIPVQLYCGLQVAQAIRTDFKGYFEFVLGAGPQGNVDYGAADDARGPFGGTGMSPNFPGASNSLGADLSGCDVRVSLAGYQPLTYTISGHPDITGVQVGTLQLTRLAGVPGSYISVTSLLIPGKARKEFEQGQKDVKNKNLKAAAEHMEKAVAQYDNYAAAWNVLGAIDLASHETEKSRQAFEKSIAADPKYLPPYLNLADFELQDGKVEDAIATAGRALQLDPGSVPASFIQAVGFFTQNNLDAAEQSALVAEKGERGELPQVHYFLADIFLHKDDDTNAAMEMRAYLKEAPNGVYAAELKHALDTLEKAPPAPAAP